MGSRAGGPPAKDASAPKVPGAGPVDRAPGRRRRVASRIGEAAPTTGAKPKAQARSSEAAATTKETTAAPLGATGPSAPMQANGAVGPPKGREAVVLAAVRALVRATAGEVAERTGQPNGSVSVALRALVARGEVARTDTARGIEYALISPGNVRPFKRATAAAPTEAPAPTAAAGEVAVQADTPAPVS
jgi:hypothetical protein